MRGGCTCADGRRRDPWIIRDLDIETTHCPAQMVTGDAWELLNLYQHYTAGFLPFAGGIMNQPSVFADAMRVIAAEINSE